MTRKARRHSATPALDDACAYFSPVTPAVSKLQEEHLAAITQMYLYYS